MSASTFAQWAEGCYRKEIASLLDDPYGVSEHDHTILINYVNDLLEIGRSLGLDFESVVNSTGTEYERQRLWKILQDGFQS